MSMIDENIDHLLVESITALEKARRAETPYKLQLGLEYIQVLFQGIICLSEKEEERMNRR